VQLLDTAVMGAPAGRIVSVRDLHALFQGGGLGIRAYSGDPFSRRKVLDAIRFFIRRGHVGLPPSRSAECRLKLHELLLVSASLHQTVKSIPGCS
jgi:hypothetical protein